MKFVTVLLLAMFGGGFSGPFVHIPANAGEAVRFQESVVVTPAAMATSKPVSPKLVPIVRGDAQRTGAWSDVLPWPLVAIHAVLLADGRVFTYGSSPPVNPGVANSLTYDIWDPRSVTYDGSHLTLPNNTKTDIFCGSQLLLGNGSVMMAGGDTPGRGGKRTNQGNADETVLNPSPARLSRSASKLQRPRWYATATTLLNGDMYIQGGVGGEDFPELRQADGKHKLLTSIPTRALQWYYPRMWVQEDGQLFGLSRSSMFRVDLQANGGQGALTSLEGDLPGGVWGERSSAVMYQPGKILQLGGHSSDTVLIDINQAAPAIKRGAQLSTQRQWANSTVLANGHVLVTGGTNNYDDTFLNKVSLHAEIFDPITQNWVVGAAGKVPRLYHSTALLLPDASVLVAGGGTPGPLTNFNAELYFPPYLFGAHGKFAARPQISDAPDVVAAGSRASITVPDASAIKRVALVKSGSVTHSFNMDQRFIELAFQASADELTIKLPERHGQTPPGFYMLFVIDHQGVPSVARMVKVLPALQSD